MVEKTWKPKKKQENNIFMLERHIYETVESGCGSLDEKILRECYVLEKMIINAN